MIGSLAKELAKAALKANQKRGISGGIAKSERRAAQREAEEMAAARKPVREEIIKTEKAEKAAEKAQREKPVTMEDVKRYERQADEMTRRELEAKARQREASTFRGSDPMREAEQLRRSTGAGFVDEGPFDFKKGGKVKAKIGSASKRADGIAKRGKTRGRFV